MFLHFKSMSNPNPSDQDLIDYTSCATKETFFHAFIFAPIHREEEAVVIMSRDPQPSVFPSSFVHLLPTRHLNTLFINFQPSTPTLFWISWFQPNFSADVTFICFLPVFELILSFFVCCMHSTSVVKFWARCLVFLLLSFCSGFGFNISQPHVLLVFTVTTIHWFLFCFSHSLNPKDCFCVLFVQSSCDHD